MPRVCCLLVLATLIVEIASYFPAQALSVVVELPRQAIPDHVFFGTGSAALKPEGRIIIQTWSRLMNENPTFTAHIFLHFRGLRRACPIVRETRRPS